MAFGGVDNPLWSWKYNTITSDGSYCQYGKCRYDFTDWLSAGYQSVGINMRWIKQVINIGSVGPSGFAGQGQITNDNYTTRDRVEF